MFAFTLHECVCVVQVIGRYLHPGPVYGCAWAVFNPTMFATACQDGSVRIFRLVRLCAVAAIVHMMGCAILLPAFVSGSRWVLLQ